MTEHEKLTEAIRSGLNGKLAGYIIKKIAPELAEYLLASGWEKNREENSNV